MMATQRDLVEELRYSTVTSDPCWLITCMHFVLNRDNILFEHRKLDEKLAQLLDAT